MSNDSVLTKKDHKNAVLRPDRPALILSSTSWTPDEDFSILLKAMQIYNRVASDSLKLPKLLVIITGKGPLKDHFVNECGKLDLPYVSFNFAWLSPTDYPLIVASATLGLSLHSSSSGVDLPMKIIDMFGCGVPALSLDYERFIYMHIYLYRYDETHPWTA